MIRNNFYKLLFWIAGVAFILNLIWENAQMPWYADYSGFVEHFLICLVATLGDVIITLAIYTVISLVKEDWFWVIHIEKRSLVLTLILGFLTAIIIEQRALLYGLWTYTNLMLRLPILGVGLLPVIQMLILPILTFWASGLTYKKTYGNIYISR